MAVGNSHKNHIDGFKKDLQEISINKEEFFKWFAASGQTIDEMFISGALDFNVHILQPVIPFLKDSGFRSVLEIGYGGGRILKPASELFKLAYGVDVHEQTTLVDEELEERGCKNVTLLSTNGKSIPLENESIQFAYSFIVFQHLQYVEIFENYLKELHRVLEQDGLAVIYFGRFFKYSLNSESKFLLQIDQIRERFLSPKFAEIQAKVNETNLRVSYVYAEKLAKEIGFDIKKRLVSYRGLPKGYGKFGGQNGFIIQKK